MCIASKLKLIMKSQVLIACEVHRYLILPELLCGKITSRMSRFNYLIESIVVHKTDLRTYNKIMEDKKNLAS